MDKAILFKLVDYARRVGSRVLLISNGTKSYNAIFNVKFGDSCDKFIVKIHDDVASIDKADLADLAVLSRVSGATPVIISNRIGGEKLHENVAYKIQGIYAVSPITFKRVLEKRGVKFVRERGITKARIKGSELRRKRLDKGLSLGDLARELGVTRKAVYEYERARIEASERVARRLIEIFGEDVLEDIPLVPDERAFERLLRQREDQDSIVSRLMASFRVYKLEKAHVDYAAYSGNENCLVKNNEAGDEAIAFAKALGVKLAIVYAEHGDVEFIENCREEGTCG